MSLDSGKVILKEGLIALQNEMMLRDADAFEYFAERMANLVYDFVKSGELEVDAGILVSTTGTAAAQSGKTTTKGTGKIK